MKSNTKKIATHNNHVRGQKHPKAKLKTAEVRSIKKFLAKPADKRPTLTSLAEKYDVTPATIRSIRDGKSWAHV